jgi:uncharacterized protein (TIGR03000 family)
MRQVMTVGAAVAVLAVLAGSQPAQAKEYPSGYDPASGWTWDQDFRYSEVTNPYGYRNWDWSSSPSYSPSFSNYYVPPINYYAYPMYNTAPSANYSYGAYAPAQDNEARIRVVVPQDAKVWFDNKATKQSGSQRHFESPALTPGKQYSYDVKAQWKDENGKEVTQTRHIDVGANTNVTVDFTQPKSGG